MLNIGLTGGIGSGKSTVAKWFKEQGVPVLDADKTAHRLLEDDVLTIEQIVRSFGPGVTENNGKIHRKRLGTVVFGDDDARKRLEGILHPRIRSSMEEQRITLQEAGTMWCIWDVPLLLEVGFDQYVDEVWVVWVPREVQLLRVQARDKLSVADVEARLAAQLSLDEKRKRADVVIDNSGSREETVRQLEKLWQKLMDRNIGGKTMMK